MSGDENIIQSSSSRIQGSPESSSPSVNADEKPRSSAQDFLVRPKLVDHVAYHQRTSYDGKARVILEQPETHRLLEVPYPDIQFLKFLDGEKTLDEIINVSEQQDHQVKSLRYYSLLIKRLLQEGFIEGSCLNATLTKTKTAPKSWKGRLLRLLTTEYELEGIDGKLDILYQMVGRHFFRWYGRLLMLFLSVVGTVLFFPLYFKSKYQVM